MFFQGFLIFGYFFLVSFFSSPPTSLLFLPLPLFWGGQSKEDIYFVVLNKEEGSGLGFSVAGGIDLEQKSIIVSGDCIFLLSGLQSQLEIRLRTLKSCVSCTILLWTFASFCTPSADALREASGPASQINSDAHKFAKVSACDRLTQILATENPNIISSIQALSSFQSYALYSRIPSCVLGLSTGTWKNF